MKKNKRRFLGQHFLVNPHALKKIVRVIHPQKDELIVEIGAGKGILTQALAQKGGTIIAVERDPALIPFLEKLESPNLKILQKDILTLSLHKIRKDHPQPANLLKIVGNLPYSISSPVLEKVLQERDIISVCVFLLQKEVAVRICAQPGSKKFAPLSILFQNYFTAQLHFTLSPGSFFPPPQVESALISLKRREKPVFPLKDEPRFRAFLQGAFRHRRKKLSNNLKRMDFPFSSIHTAFHRIGLKENVRPEQLSLSQFVSIYEFLYFPPSD